MPLPFADRAEAGRELAARLDDLAGEDVIVLGLPRGGVPVAAAVAVALSAPLDVFVVRKLGTPGQPELAMGAIATGGVRVLNDGVVNHLRIPAPVIEEVAERELAELQRREHEYRGDRPAPDLADRTVVLIDDGLATGATMRAAVEAVRQQHPRSVVVAVPVAAPESCRMLESVADRVVCVHTPRRFGGVGAHYVDFTQTTDGEVRHLLSPQT